MLDLSMYAGRWIARTESGEVASVGLSLEDARYAGRLNRPKERLHFAWVSPHPPHLALPEWPLELLRPLFPPTGVWLVGGSVRDLLLGRAMHDWDFVVQTDALRLARRVANALRGAYYPLDEERETGRVIVADPQSGAPVMLDFALWRGDSLESDLRLRDFTVNALALSLEGELFDYTQGRADLEKRLIRLTHSRSFQDDPARLVRAVRQAGMLGFRLEMQTELALRAQVSSITRISPERLRAEYLNIVAMPAATDSLQALYDTGLLLYTLPEIQALYATQQSWPHYYRNAWDHSLATIAAVEGIQALLHGKAPHPCVQRYLPLPAWAWKQLGGMLGVRQAALLDYLTMQINADMPRGDLLKWGALFHDVGKTQTRTLGEDGLVHFYGHEKSGAQLTAARLGALRFPNKAVAFVTVLVEFHMRLIGLSKEPVTRRAAYRFFHQTGDAGVGVVLLSLADALAVWGRKLDAGRWQALLATAQALLTAYFEQQEQVVAPTPLLTGHDLLALGAPSGPPLGRLLEALREAQAAGEVATRDAALTFIQTQLNAQEPAP